MNKPTITFGSQDRIEAYAEVGRVFLAEFLGQEWDACLLTDESGLSDFVGCGGVPEDLHVEDGTYPAYSRAWGAWILPRINAKYGLNVTDRHIYLVELFALIESAATANVRH